MCSCLFFALLSVNCSKSEASPTLNKVEDAHSDKLMHVIKMIKQRQSPSAEDVLEAYKEYINLHKMQATLASLSDKLESNSNSSVNDLTSKYDGICKILGMQELRLINENLFNVIQVDGNPERIMMNRSLKRKITSAVDNMF